MTAIPGSRHAPLAMDAATFGARSSARRSDWGVCSPRAGPSRDARPLAVGDSRRARSCRVRCPNRARTPARFSPTPRASCSITRCSTRIRASSATSRRRRRRSACSATSWRRRSTRTSARGRCRRPRPRSRRRPSDGSPSSSAFRRTAAGCSSAAATWRTSSASLAARAAKAPWNVRAEGIAAGTARCVVYASAETHTWIQKAADLCRPRHRRHPLDRDRRTRCAWTSPRSGGRSTRTRLPGGCRSSSSARPARSAPAPSIRCRDRGDLPRERRCGSTSTARTAASPPRRRMRPRICARSRDADSVAVDPHKWLYAPLEAGCALVRDADALLRARSRTTRPTTTSTSAR